MIGLLALLFGAALAQAPAPPDGAVVRLRVDGVPVAPELERATCSHDVPAPGHGGPRTRTGVAWQAHPEWLITNRHVVAGARRLRVEAADGTLLGELDPCAAILARDADLAAVPWTGSPLPLGPEPAEGDPVVLVGFPHDRDLATAQGTITGATERALPHRPPRAFLLTDAAVEVGMSGGPALDAQGRVIGVVVAGSRADDVLAGQGLLVPVDAVDDLLQEVTSEPGPTTTTHWNPDGTLATVSPRAAALGLRVGDRAAGGPPDASGGPTVILLADGTARVLPAE